MNSDFPRILQLLRKEKSISQKQAAAQLGISQALLSHYEKGIRECGLDFLVRCADFYGVSCDYLLGRSADRTGLTLSVEELPDGEGMGKENVFRGGVLPVLNKKLLVNSLNILYDLLAKSNSKGLVNEVSAFLMLAVYRMFRVVYLLGAKNQDSLFAIPRHLSQGYANAAMQTCEANASAISQGLEVPGFEEKHRTQELLISTESLSAQYPLYATSLLNLIRNSEQRAMGKGQLH